MQIIRRVCPICNDTRRELYREYWVVCQNCGLIYSPEVTRCYYYEDCLKNDGVVKRIHYDTQNSKIKRRIENPETYKKETWKSRYAVALKHCPVKKDGVLLEIGFGGGEILDYAREHGVWSRIVGFEVYDDYVLYARERGYEVYYNDVALGKPVAELLGKFDLIIMNEITEHIEDPVLFFNGAKQYLKTDGILWSSFACVTNREEMPKDEWNWWTEKPIRLLAEKCDLEVVRLDSMPVNYFGSFKKK